MFVTDEEYLWRVKKRLCDSLPEKTNVKKLQDNQTILNEVKGAQTQYFEIF